MTRNTIFANWSPNNFRTLQRVSTGERLLASNKSAGQTRLKVPILQKIRLDPARANRLLMVPKEFGRSDNVVTARVPKPNGTPSSTLAQK